MKTFEERYTAWIDGQLDGPALSAFEREIARRAAEGEAEADKADTARLRTLLQDHFQAPPLTNADFFSHQLRERIDAESTALRRRELPRGSQPGLFAWGFARLVGLGALSLFAAAALYYGMMPPHGGTPSELASVNRPAATVGKPADSGGHAPDTSTPDSATQVATTQSSDPDGTIKLVQLTVTPSPIDLAPDIKTTVPDQPANPTTVTPLHYNKPNVNVLWLNGLEYLPSVSEAAEASPAATAASASVSPAPAPSASASP